MASNDYGYIGSKPSQTYAQNSGVFSLEEQILLHNSNEWTYQLPTEGLDIWIDGKLGSYTGTTVENMAATSYGSGIGSLATVGATRSTSAANYGGAFIFDGSNDYINKNYDADFNDWRTHITINFWFKCDNFSSTRRNPFNNGYGGLGTVTTNTNGTVSYYHGTHGDDSTPYQGTSNESALSAGTVYNLTLVRNSSTVKWYLNGQETNSVTNSYPTAANGSNNLWIGRGYAGWFDGAIYVMQVYDNDLTAAQVQQLYQFFAPRFT
jgi:hypothetical protein